MCEEDKKAEPPKDIAADLMSAVTYAYLNPTKDTADENGHAQLKLLAEDFGMTPIKVRKMLITSGAYQTVTSINVNSLYKSGKSVKEIQAATGLSPASISGYLPYRKTVYNLEESTCVAERLRKFRKRRKAAEQIKKAIKSDTLKDMNEAMWDALIAFEGYSFQTAKGLRYTYTVKGNELFFSRKEKSVTRASVEMALETAIELRKSNVRIRGPKMLRCFGASYLYPIFIRFGVICDGEPKV